MKKCQIERLIKDLEYIEEDIDCDGFILCPGVEGNRIYNMKTCRSCAARIKLMRIIKSLKKEV